MIQRDDEDFVLLVPQGRVAVDDVEPGPQLDHLDLVVEPGADLAPVVVGLRRHHDRLTFKYHIVTTANHHVDFLRVVHHREVAVVRTHRADASSDSALVDTVVLDRHLEAAVLDHEPRGELRGADRVPTVRLQLGLDLGCCLRAEGSAWCAGQEQVVEELPQVATLELVRRVRRHGHHHHGLLDIRDVRVLIDSLSHLVVVHAQVAHQLLAGLVGVRGLVADLRMLLVPEVGEREEAAVRFRSSVKHRIQIWEGALTVSVHPVLHHSTHRVADVEVVGVVVVPSHRNVEAVLGVDRTNHPAVVDQQVLRRCRCFGAYRRGKHQSPGRIGTCCPLGRVASLRGHAPQSQRAWFDHVDIRCRNDHGHVFQVHRRALGRRQASELIGGRAVAVRVHEPKPTDVQVVRCAVA